MRDIFEDIFPGDTTDPTEAARRAMRPNLRKRFYRDATIGDGPEGFSILLDGKPVRTPAHHPLAAPTRVIAEAIVAEWNAQRDVIDPAQMPLTRLANTVIDGVAQSRAEVAAEIVKYLGSDLLFYRAEGPEGLVARHAQHWDPVLDWARHDLGARFVLAQGVAFVTQPEQAIAAARGAVPDDVWRLGALSAVTTLTGSALLALALLHGRLSVEQAWRAAHVDEDWNMDTWGHDEVALARRAFRFDEMRAAALILAAGADPGPP